MDQPHPNAALGHGARPHDRPRRAEGEARPRRRLQADHGPEPLGVRRQAHPWVAPLRHARRALRRGPTRTTRSSCTARTSTACRASPSIATSSGAGTGNVRRYSGGLLDWEDAGLPLEGEFVTAPMSEPTTPAPPPRHPYAAEIEEERSGWYELVDARPAADARGVPRPRLLRGPRLDRARRRRPPRHVAGRGGGPVRAHGRRHLRGPRRRRRRA